MSWNNWSYWLRGGLIGLGFILLVIILIFISGSEITTLEKSVRLLYDKLTLPLNYLISSDMKGLNILLLSPIFYFLIGALIGWIYGLIKSKGGRK